MKAFLITVLLIALCAVIYLFKPFLLDIAIAALMAVATANLNALMAAKIKHASLRAFILSCIITALFLGPFTYAALALASSLKNSDLAAFHTLISWLKSLRLPDSLAFLQPKLSEFLAAPDLSALAKSALNYASNFSSKGVKFITDLFLIIVFYFFANFYSKQLLQFLRSLLPLERAQWASLLNQLSSVMSVVFYSVIITAVFEGVLFALIASVFDYDALLCGILYAFSSLIPVIGGALLWLPLAALEYSQGNTANALVIALYSIIVISTVADTFIKPLIIRYINERFLKTSANINELLIFFAMLAGISTFGFWGIILGPAVLAFFMASAKLFSEHNKNN